MNPVRSNPNFLFLTPEGLESRLDSLQKLHQDGKIARFVVDEAQCVLVRLGRCPRTVADPEIPYFRENLGMISVNWFVNSLVL